MIPFPFTRRNTAKLLATGQTVSYGSGTGVDDGALQKGIAKRYTIYTTGQYSGTTDITINSKTDTHSNNCVFDDMTGLMWSRYLSASVGPSSDGRLPWTTTGSGATAEGIFPYVAAANAASLAGFSDWRIPNYYSLISLLKLAAPNANPNSTAFPSWTALGIWCSTTQPDTTTQAFYIEPTSGYTYVSLKTIARICIFVRG